MHTIIKWLRTKKYSQIGTTLCVFEGRLLCSFSQAMSLPSHPDLSPMVQKKYGSMMLIYHPPNKSCFDECPICHSPINITPLYLWSGMRVLNCLMMLTMLMALTMNEVSTKTFLVKTKDSTPEVIEKFPEIPWITRRKITKFRRSKYCNKVYKQIFYNLF